jgi:hypothetical protein
MTLLGVNAARGQAAQGDGGRDRLNPDQQKEPIGIDAYRFASRQVSQSTWPNVLMPLVPRRWSQPA